MEISSLLENRRSQEMESVLNSNKSELGKKVRRCDYINRINYANFENIPLLVLFRHKIYDRTLSLQAAPEPCFNDNLQLKWADIKGESEDLSQFYCEKVLIPDFDNFLAIFIDKFLITSLGMTLGLPDDAYELTNRKKIRETAQKIQAVIIQNGTLFEGSLENFNSEGFLIILEKQSGTNFKLLNKGETISVLFKKEGVLVYSGDCHISIYRDDNKKKECVAVPLSKSIKRFTAKEFRGERYTLNSSIHISFKHPLSGKRKNLKIRDISGSGFAVIESEYSAVLFAGLILSHIQILLPGNSALNCTVQVIYSSEYNGASQKLLKCGLAILDMDPDDYSKLLNFIHHDLDDRANVSRNVDMTTLWRFFFESGFIYPEKYKHISANKDKIKKLYHKLYTEQPGIARHFIYQEENHIQGHMSMLRSYENSWLLQHHAASSINSQYSGLHVLNQVGSFTNNSHRIGSMHMNYLMCYYRKENKFPNKIFGGLAENIDNIEQCTIDDWAYFHLEKNDCILYADGSDWTLTETTTGELNDLNCYYDRRSGGLMFKALNLAGDDMNERSLFNEYKRSGFTREIILYTIKYKEKIYGTLMLDQSEAGLNMSDLTNSFKVFITNPEFITKNILKSLIAKLFHFFPEESRIPVLLYPHNAAYEMDLIPEKIYTLWVLNMEATDSYFHFLKKLLKKIRH